MTAPINTINLATNNAWTNYGIMNTSASSTQTIYYYGQAYQDDWVCAQAGYIVGCYASVQTTSTSGTITCVPYNLNGSAPVSALQIVFTLSATVTGNLYGYAYSSAGVALGVGTDYRQAVYYSSASGTAQVSMIVRYS